MSLDAHVVVPVDIPLQIPLEDIGVVSLPIVVKLGLDHREEVFGLRVVEAVSLAGHGLGDPHPLERESVGGHLVLPAHVGMKHGPRVLRHPLQQPVEQELLLIHVGAGRRRPRDYLLAAEVVHRREVRLAPGLLELRDVGAHLLPRSVGGEVAPDNVLEGLADGAPVRVVPMAADLAADAAADPHLAHHLEHGLAGDARAQLGAQAHGHLPVAAAVGGAREDLRHRPAQLGPGRPGRVRQRVVAAGTGEAGALEQVGEGMLPRKPVHDDRLIAV